MIFRGELSTRAHTPEVRERLLAVGVEPATGMPEQFAAFAKSETAKWGRVVKLSGAGAD